jgi:hypothetical protein
MAREYGKNWFSMWTDEDFCTGQLFDKLFYQVLIGQSGTNDAGIVPINFRKWRKALRNGAELPTELDVKASLVRQERRRYVFTDEDTGEVLIRSHIRRDQVFRQPAVMVSALRDLASCQSPKFALIMLAELDRIEMPEIKSGTKQAERLRDSLKLNHIAACAHLETLSEGLEEPLPEPFIEDFLEGFPEPFPRPGKTEPFHQGSPEGSMEPPVVVEVVVGSPLADGQVGRARARDGENGQAVADLDRDDPPPPTCPKHKNHTDPPPCGPCGVARKAREAWDAGQAERATKVRAAFWAEVRACPDCDERGNVEAGRNFVDKCPKHDWGLIHA